MRQEKVIQIDGKDITIKELKTSDVISLTESTEGAATLLGLIQGNHKSVMQMLRKSIDLPDEELASITEGINGYSILDAAFREVNSDFLASLPARFEGLLRLAKGLGLRSSSVVS